uniref:Uncharacterized protein n=1 Tax=Siphoviridae sp. ctK9J6 TaxID=2825437 RepID=A0A8S5Q9T1_9CAUD|nr:MAG TPA: hypothetical protein [Siphoviridae sp. ctK9J6]
MRYLSNTRPLIALTDRPILSDISSYLLPHLIISPSKVYSDSVHF